MRIVSDISYYLSVHIYKEIVDGVSCWGHYFQKRNPKPMRWCCTFGVVLMCLCVCVCVCVCANMVAHIHLTRCFQMIHLWCDYDISYDAADPESDMSHLFD